MNHLYVTGSFCYIQNIKGNEYYVTLTLGATELRPVYEYMWSMRELPERLDAMVESCIKNNGAGQLTICVIEYFVEDGASLIQLKNLDVTVEQLYDREPESFYHTSVPVLSYDEFRRIIEGNNSNGDL